jgi:toxin ParE1/3/4
LTRRVLFNPEAEDDLLEIHEYISGQSSLDLAFSYLQRIEAFYLTPGTFPYRGQSIDPTNPDLRIVGLERRIAVAFHVRTTDIVILRVLYGGRNIASIQFPPTDPDIPR